MWYLLTTNPTATTKMTSFITRPVYVPNQISDSSYVRILDTTLRDGEQTLGVNFSSDQKLEIARKLAQLGVDIIEAGFPASTPETVEVVKRIAVTVGRSNGSEAHVPVICVLSRCTRKDIEASWEAVGLADHPRVKLFIATSEIHMKYKLKMSRAQVLERAKDAITYAKSLGFTDIAFSAEDASRSEREFLYQVYGEAIKQGATTIGLADTVGYMFPQEWAQLLTDIKKNVVGVDDVVLATHCHDDLGLATANSLAAVGVGARQVDVTINGLGERAGNAPLEEIAMALKCRGKDLLGGLHTGINTEFISSTSEMVEKYSGLVIQATKSIVGANAFAHAAGIHQDGMLKHRGTYEILSPEDIGRSRTDHLGIVLGKLSGRHGLQSRLHQLGYELDPTKFDDIFARFKAMAENKKHFSDDDVKSLVLQEV